MTRIEVVSRISNQLRMIVKDDYVSNRFVLSVAESIARKFIAQKIQNRTIDRDSSLFIEVPCIDFEPVDVFTCKYVEFKSCKKLSKSVVKIKDLIYTRYGASVKELYSIDRQHLFTQSTLAQLRNDSKRQGYTSANSNFYILDDYIYIAEEIETLSGLFLHQDIYDLEEITSCNDVVICESAWLKKFVAPDSVLEDIISMSIQQITITKQIKEDPTANLNNNG